MGKLLVLFIVATFVAGFEASCSQNQVNAVRTCYQQWFLGYNISMGTNLPEYWSFHDVRMSMLLDRGANAQPYICQLGNALIACVDSTGCVGEHVYEQLGAYNSTETRDYWIDFSVTKQQCGPQYQCIDEFYCIAWCRDRFQSKLDDCSAQLQRNLFKGLCKAEQEWLECQSQVMQNCCDFNAGVFMCGTNLAGIVAASPTCYNEGKLSCPPAQATPC